MTDLMEKITDAAEKGLANHAPAYALDPTAFRPSLDPINFLSNQLKTTPSWEAEVRRRMADGVLPPSIDITERGLPNPMLKPELLFMIPEYKNSLSARLGEFEQQNIDLRSTLHSAYLLNLLTEDNLPWYTTSILPISKDIEPLLTWLKWWTREEHSHGVVMRDYAIYSGIISDDLIPANKYHAGVDS
jgi:hypothetical protein